MTSGVPRLHAPLRSIAQAKRGPWRAGRGEAERGRCVYLALGLVLALSLPAFAEDAAQPDTSSADAQTTVQARPGMHRFMVRYARPVMHNGKLVLWHGAWRNGAVHPRPMRAAATDDAATPDASKTAGAHSFSILADSSDPTATRLANELAGVMSGDDTQIKVLGAPASRAAIAKAVGADSADFALVTLDGLIDPAQSSVDWRRKAPFVARLQNEEIEVIAPRAIANINQLSGRKVNVGAADSAAAGTAGLIFSHLGVPANWTTYPLDDALQRLKDGKIDAVVVVGGKNSESLSKFGDDGRFHLVSIPYSPALRPYYAPARATKSDWPNLVAADEKVETLSTPIALVAIDGAVAERADRLAPAANKFLASFDQLLDDSKDQGWRDVNLAARIDQLPRFGAAQAWLDQNKGEASADLEAFRAAAQAADAANGGPSGADSDKLYQSLTRLGGAAQ
jgi:TRAP-type uncharacterized transport system substrate-binding protein